MTNSSELKIILYDYCDKVVPNLFKKSAGVSAKIENVVSYPTHIINAVFTGAALYAYEHANSITKDYSRDLKLLISIITLHDIGKYLLGKYSKEGGNSKENIQTYFESDDFNIKNFFPEINEMIGNEETLNEIVWLVQNTELNDENRMETFGHKTEFGKLADYSRLGDKVASLTREESYVSKIFDTLKYHNVHVVYIPKFPQFFIRQKLLKAVKKYYDERETIPFLLFEDGLFYVSNEIIIPELDKIREYLLAEIKDSMRLVENDEESENANLPFAESIRSENKNNGNRENEPPIPLLDIRIDFQSIDDSSIIHFPLPKGDKKKILVDAIIRKIPKAMKGVVISLPPNKEIQRKITTIIYYLYKCSDLTPLPDSIKEKIKLFKNDDTIGSQKYKIYIAKEIMENYEGYGIDEIYNFCDEFLDLQFENQNNTSLFDKIIKTISVDFQHTLETSENPLGKHDMCFLCGSKANVKYQAGRNYFLQARGFSKRGAIFEMQKKICSLCLIERSLIESTIAEKGYNFVGDYLFAIFYFDRIFANISYFSKELSNVPLEPASPIEYAEHYFRLGDFNGMHFIIPYRYSGKEESAKQSSRVNVTKQILSFISGYGCKATLTSPYTLLRMYNELFVNENPTRLEMSLNIAVVRDFDTLSKIDEFLDVVYTLDRKKGYYQVGRYDFFSLIHYLKLKTYDLKRVAKEKYLNAVNNCFWEESMKIKDLAKKGKDFYGNVWGSSYKRTVLMRTALDALLIGLQQQFSEEELKTFVSAQIYKLAMREKFAKKREAENYVVDFVDSLIQYLKEKKWLSVHELSSVEKYLVDAYEFEIISLR